MFLWHLPVSRFGWVRAFTFDLEAIVARLPLKRFAASVFTVHELRVSIELSLRV